MDMDEYDLYTSGAEGQDAGPSLDYMMHLNMIMNQPHLPEEDIYTARDEKPRPSAPLDIAKFKIKVDWIEPFPERWRARLQIALQSWLSRLEGKPSVHNVKLMEDPSCAEVQITPSTALKVLKYHRTVSLKFKDYKDGKDKEVTAQIYLDEAHSVCLPQKSLLEENKAPSSKVNSTKPVTSAVSEDTNTSDDVVAATRASNDAEIRKSFKMTHETLAGISLPVYQFWYLHHAYRKELELIEKQHGVSMHAEVSVSFKSTQRSSSDSVSKASEDFQKLLSECVESFSQASINHKYMDSVIVKEALHYIRSEKTKMMFTMSASDCRFFGPKQFTDIIKRETTRLENQFKNKSKEMDVDNAVSCELTKPTDQTTVAPIVEKLQQQNYCVVAANEFSPWKLVGLPEHLGPAIADIEKKLQKHVFDEKRKKLIGYSGDIPHARGIRWNRTPEYGPGAVAGAAGDEDVNSRGRDQTESCFNKESEINAKHESKGAHAEEEMCPICMDSFTDNEKLKCGHEFCRECIRMSVESLGPICPVCKEVFGKIEGNQPDGTMKVMKNRLSLPGYPNCGTIQIHYNIPSGIQMKRHPNPGQYFHGARCQAYLPDNREGRKVLSLLQRAFDQKLIFTVGTSTTSGLKNAVTWNDIHHKTNTHGGPLNYGYPDPDYLRRVKDELKAKGIE